MDYGFKRAGMTFSLMLICILAFSNAFSQACTGDPNSMSLDDDFDGYKNGDETLNGTDKCSSMSVPLDFDEDYTSDMLDADDDNDGLSDIADKFALDKQNGTTTNIPVYYKFQNPNNGGIGNSGFTGLMNNGSNYSSLYTLADLVIGGPTSKFIVNNIPVGDALAASNTQKNGFQFGVKAGAFPFNYTISSRVMAPFAAIIPADFQSMGMFMGTGDQDNYLKIACASNGGVGGIEVVKEVAGMVTSNMYNAPILGASQVNFYFTVNRAANTVQPSYSKNGGAAVNIGSAISVPSSWLSNVLAVGIISTSRGATPFSASWDNIAVQPITGNGQWQTINTTNTCIARHDCGFVENGSRFFLLGGHGVTTMPTEYYNYSSKTWSIGADVRDATPPIPLHHFQAVQIRGMIYFGCAFTGETPNDVPADNVYFYDPPYNLYHVGREIPEERRRGAAAAVAHNEKIYFIGGLKTGHNAGWTNYLDVFDPYTNTWTILPDAPRQRDHFQAVVHNGKIYCIGGRKTGFGGSAYAETVEQTDVYDIEEQTWTTLPSPECDIPTPRGGASVALIGDEIFVMGGENMSQTAALKTTEAFNVKTKTWRTVASLNTGRHGTQAIVNNYAIYIVGGAGNRGESPDLSSMEVFYPYGTATPSGTAITKGFSTQLPSDNISFGQVPIGTTSTKSVWLKNTGGAQAMVITKIQVAANSTNFYSVTYPYTTPYTVNPGDSTKIQVTFRPNSNGVINGTLYTSNTLTDADNTSFGLAGTGVTQQPAVRINCTGPQFTAASSNVFSEDFYNLPGTTGLSTSQPISGTSDDFMYQTARSGSAFSYNIPVQNNTYTVNLYFAEIASNAVAGINVFDVKIENSMKITGLDLFTTAGLNTAYTRTFTIPVTDQMMNLDFIASAGNARVSAIELIPAAVTQGILTSVPMPVEFPETDLFSSSAPITVTLTNTGTASLNITSVSITGTNATNFVQTYGVNPTTVPPGSTKTFTVTFTPTTSGLKTATLNVSNTGMNTTLSIPLKGTGSSTTAPCGYFVEQNGLLVMEVESQKPTGYWDPGTAIPNYTGTEYYTWQGPNYFFEKGHGLMRYEFKITTPGKYRYRLRSRHPGPDPTHFNDIWVRFPDHGATFEKNGQVMQESGTGWWIMSMATADAWTYNSWGLRRTYWEIYVEFKDPGIYYVDLAGRVEYFSIDRMVLYKQDQYTEWQACGSNPPQSSWEDCPATPYTWYRDKDLDDYGDPNVTVQAFTKPGAGWIWNNQDCNDNHAESYPGAPEVLDGRDNDCNGIVDDGALLDALNINCGGSQYLAVNGDAFESDRLFTPTNTSTKFFSNTGDILNTDDDALFKSERLNSQYTSAFNYNLKAAPGKFYKVSLHFAEQGTIVNPGERVFKVLVEDSLVLNNFDIIATVGYKTAYVHEAYVYLRDSVLNIKFVDITGKAKINAIKAAIQPNIPPTFKLYPVFPAFTEDFTGTKSITLTPDSVYPHELYQTVTYSLSPATCSFANMSINPITGQVSYTSVPNGNGVQIFTVIANDSQAENNIATKTFQLKVLAVNDKPTFTMSGNVNVNKNFLGTMEVTATPAPVPADEASQVVTYSLSPSSISFANVSINSATGKVSITSVSDMYGTQVFTVTANDGMPSNSTYTQTFTLTVNNINNPPTLNAIADITINEDAGMQTVNFSGVTAGTGENQSFTVNVSSDNTLLIPAPFLDYTFPGTTGSLNFTPAADRSGIAHITVSVTDASLTTSKTFTVNVNSINDAPLFALSSNAVTVDEDFSGTQQIIATPGYVPAEEMSQVVSYSLSPASVSFANVSINSSTGKVTITSAASGNGSQLFTVTANDGQSQNNMSSQAFMLTVNSVNDAPAFTTSGDVNVNEDFAAAQYVTVSPMTIPADEVGQAVSYSLSPASISFANVSINSSTGEVTITSIADASGSQMFTITANDGQSQNNTSSQAFMLTVNSVNDAPAFTTSGDVSVSEDFATAQHVTVSAGFIPADEMSQVVTYSLSPASVSFANVSINSSTGEVTIASVANANGSQLFTITANDGQSQNNMSSQTFTLNISSVNDAPAFTMSGDVSVSEDFAAAQHVSVTPMSVPADEAAQVVTYSLSPASVSFANVSINSSTGEVTITSIANASGSQLFTVTANDGQSQNNMSSQTFMLTVNSVNDAPAFTTSGDVTVNEDFAAAEHVTVSPMSVPADEMSQVVSYSLSPASVSFANVSINSVTGEVTITSIANASGSQLFTIMADDGQSQSNTSLQTFMLTVNSENDAPVFTTSGDVTVNEDFATAQHVMIIPGFIPADEVAQVVTYSLSPASVSFASVSINSSTGEVTIASIADEHGSQLFTVTANDGQSQNNTYAQTFMVTVNSVNDAPAFVTSGDVTVNEDFAAAQHVIITPAAVPANEMSQVVSYSLMPASISFANVSINSSTGEVTITSIANASGSQMFTVTADDGQSQNNTHSQTFMLTVNSVNDAPTFVTSGDVNVNEDFAAAQHVTMTAAAVPADEMSQVVSYSLSPASVSFANISFNSATGEVTITSIANAFGSQLFNVTANDGQSQNNLSSQTFMLNVSSVNDAPAFTLSGDITVIEGLYTSATETVTPGFVPADEMSQAVVYSLSPISVSFANVSINSATGEVTVTPIADQFSSQMFTVTASDGQSQNNTYSQIFNLTVEEGNNPPSFTLSGDVNADEDFGTQHVTVTPDLVRPHEAGQVVTYSLSPASVSFANISFDSNTGEVAITSIADAHGSQQFTITADDGQNRSNLYSQTFTLTVNSVNDAPLFMLSGDVNVMENFQTPETVTISAGFIPADEMGQVIIYSLSPASVSFANVSINSLTGEVTSTSVQDEFGSQLFTVTADDGQSQNNLYSQTFTLTVNEGNNVPSFTTSGDIIVDEDFSTTEIVTVTHDALRPVDIGQTVTYSLSPASVNFANVSVNRATGEATITSIADANGSQLFTITADDGQSVNNLYLQSFMLMVNPVNDAPVFTHGGDIMVDEDFSTTEVIAVIPGLVPADEIGQVVSYSLSPASVSFANVIINSSTGDVTITSIADANGSQMFTITADDGQGVNNFYLQSFMLAVNSVNDAPAFTHSGDIMVDEDFGTAQHVTVSPAAIPADEMNQAVAYSLSPSSVSFANVSINSATGEVMFTSIADTSGSQMFTITADDGQSVSNLYRQSFMLTVNSVNDDPAFTHSGDINVAEDFATAQQVTVIAAAVPVDEMSQTVAYSLSPSFVSFANVSINSATGEVTITSIADASGSQMFTITADDGEVQNNTYSQAFTLTVNVVNDAPIFSVDHNVTVVKNFTTIETVNVIPGAVPVDEANQTVTYWLNPASVIFANVSFNSATGAVAITSIAERTGSQVFTITADDGQSMNNLHAEQFTLMVIDTNYQPTLDVIADPSDIDEDAGLQIIQLTGITAGFNESQPVSVTAVSDNPALITHPVVAYNNPDHIGSLSYTPVANQNGVAVITVTVEDGQNMNNTITRSFTVVVDPVNDEPTLDVINDQIISEDALLQTITLTGISAGPNEAQSLVVTAVADNPSLIANLTVSYSSLGATGTLTYVPAANLFGSAVITVTVNDGQSYNNISSRMFTITVAAVDDLPVLTDVYKNGQEDKNLGFQAFNFTNHIQDIESDTLTAIRIVTLPVNGSLLLNGNSVSVMTEIVKSDIGNLTYDPMDEFAGADSFSWNGMAGAQYALSNAKVYININAVNDKPYIVSQISDLTVKEDAASIAGYVDLDNVFTDVENTGNLIYTVVNSNPSLVNVTIDNGHILDISFNENTHGDASIVIHARDQGNGTVMDTLEVMVLSVEDVPAAFNLLTPANGNILSAQPEIDFTWEESADGDGDVVTYSVTVRGLNLDTTVSIMTSTSLVMSSSLFVPNSDYTWFVTASDGDDETGSAISSFKLTLTSVSDPYTLVSKVNAYPNPFSAETQIIYSLKSDAKVTLKIFNFLGQEIETLADGIQMQGEHTVKWNGFELPSGVYFYELMMETKGGMNGSFVGKIVKE